MQTSNPVLRKKAFEGEVPVGERMTMNGTITRTAVLLMLTIVTGSWTWARFSNAMVSGDMSTAVSAISPFMWGGLIVGLVVALATVFRQRWAPITAPAYALAEGFALGGMSAFMEMRFHGIVLQAVMLTVGVLAVMLLLYRTGVIKVTDKFRMGVMAATGGIALLYLVNIGLHAFTSVDIPFINGGGAMGIGFSLLVVGLAALNLVLDFDMIQRATEQGAPKYMEWYGAFALMVTLVWLYLELLRLLSKARR